MPRLQNTDSHVFFSGPDDTESGLTTDQPSDISKLASSGTKSGPSGPLSNLKAKIRNKFNISQITTPATARKFKSLKEKSQPDRRKEQERQRLQKHYQEKATKDADIIWRSKNLPAHEKYVQELEKRIINPFQAQKSFNFSQRPEPHLRQTSSLALGMNDLNFFEERSAESDVGSNETYQWSTSEGEPEPAPRPPVRTTSVKNKAYHDQHFSSKKGSTTSIKSRLTSLSRKLRRSQSKSAAKSDPNISTMRSISSFSENYEPTPANASNDPLQKYQNLYNWSQKSFDPSSSSLTTVPIIPKDSPSVDDSSEPIASKKAFKVLGKNESSTAFWIDLKNNDIVLTKNSMSEAMLGQQHRVGR